MNVAVVACLYCTVDLDEMNMSSSEMSKRCLLHLIRKNENEDRGIVNMTGW